MSGTNGVDRDDASAVDPGGSFPWLKLVVFLVLVSLFAYLSINYRDALTLERLADHESQLKRALDASPLLVYSAAFGIYVLVTALSIPGAAVLTVACGWVFGVVNGTILVSFASTTGATFAFLMSRYLFGLSIQRKFAVRLQTFNEALEREGALYLFTLRLIPAVPFFVINVVMGLTMIKLRTFWWVSQVGMLAGTAVYVGAGAAVPDVATLQEQGLAGILTPQIFVAFVILGIFPLVVKRVFRRFRRQGAAAQPDDAPSPARDDSVT